MKGTKTISTKSAFSNIFFCLRFLFKINKRLFWIRIPSTVFLTLANFVNVIFMRYIFNALTEGGGVKTVLLLVAGMVAVSFIISTLNAWLSKIDTKEKERTSYKLNVFLSDLAMQMKYEDLEDPRMKDFISLAGSSNPFFDVLMYTTGFISALLNVSGFAAIIMTIQPIIFLFLGLVVLSQIIIERKMREYQGSWRQETGPIFRRRNYLTDLASIFRFGKEIRVNQLESWVLDKFHQYHEDHVWPADRKNRKALLRFNSLTEGISVLQQAVVYLYLGYKVVFQGILLGDFTMYMTSIDQFSNYIGGLIGNYSLLMGAGITAREIRYCMEVAGRQDKDTEEGSLDGFDKDTFVLTFENVSFRYPGTEKVILKNINIEIKSGQTLSLVGENGAGKSTFVKLLCRFYEPTEGRILLNGRDVAAIPYAAYADLLAVVFQDYKLFAYSVAENITLCQDPDPGRLWESIEKSGLEEKIRALPQQEETMMYKEFDPQGIEFSGGEGQKVAIARAIYQDAPIIILDEPTSALDPIAEYEVYKRFSEMCRGKSAVYISHRMSSSRFTDKIAVFSDGRVCEYGSHKELMEIENGVYQKMFAMQAQYYQ